MNADSWARRSWRVVVLVVLAGCDGPARPPSSGAVPTPVAATPGSEVVTPTPVAATPTPVAASQEEQRFTGVLKYTELPRTKSVEAYMGREFSLVTEKDGELNVKASAAVSGEQLRALDGATITVRAKFHEETKPDPHESAPMGGDNTAMTRPSYYEVLEVVSGAPVK